MGHIWLSEEKAKVFMNTVKTFTSAKLMSCVLLEVRTHFNYHLDEF
jgi:hypothetical protein